MWGREPCFQFENSDVDIRVQASAVGEGDRLLTIKVSELLIRELYVNCARCAVSWRGLGQWLELTRPVTVTTPTSPGVRGVGGPGMGEYFNT